MRSSDLVDLAAAQQLRGFLEELGYLTLTGQLSQAAWQELDQDQPERLTAELAQCSNADVRPLATVLLLGQPVAADVNLRHVWQLAARLGLVALADSIVQPKLRVAPVWWSAAGDLVVSDHLPAGPLPADHVMAASGSARTLRTITPKHAAGSAMDLGCGSGVQTLGLLAAGHQVLATDVNPRALQCTSLSVALSIYGQSEHMLQLRQNSLFENVDDEFDLIVTSPPFVMAPSQQHTYRDSPLAGDALLTHLLQQGSRFLKSAGVLVALGNWLEKDDFWDTRLATMAPATGATWIARRQQLSAQDYVDLWLHDSHENQSAQLKQRRAGWLDYLSELGAASIGFGWIMHVRTDEPAQALVEDVQTATRLPTGAETAWQLQVLRQVPTAQKILSSRLELAPQPPAWRAAAELSVTASWWLVNAPDYADPFAAISECASTLGVSEIDVMHDLLVNCRRLIAAGCATITH